MDRDFHFGATYALALEAGKGAAGSPDIITPQEALTIARAAQYVDEFSSKAYQQVRGAYPSRNKGLTQTVQDTSALILHNTANWTGVDHWTAQIWPVFHFLPVTNPPEDMPQVVSPDPDAVSMRPLICRPYSPLANAVILEARRVWAKLSAGGKYTAKREDYLIRIGITMHVLADTFAHANFMAFPSKYINEVSDITDVHTGKRIYLLPGKDYSPAFSFEGYGYMGHGRCGHLPDEAWLHYKYKAQWTGLEFQRDNPAIYAEAYFYLKHVLEYIFGKQTSFPKRREEIAMDVGKLQALEDFFRTQAGDSVEKQMEAWKRENGGAAYTAPDFSTEAQFMMKFARQAWKHQDCVLSNCPMLRDLLSSQRVTDPK